MNRRHRTAVLSIVALALGLSSAGCKKKKDYETKVTLTRLGIVRKDEAGNPLTMDVEYQFSECPGTQIEIIRGGPEFSRCMTKYKLGDRVDIQIKRFKDPEGFWDWDILKVGDCGRVPDPNDQASYKMVRECSDWKVNEVSVGFDCDYSEQKALKKACPWFARH